VNEKFLRFVGLTMSSQANPAHKPVGQFDHFIFTFVTAGNPDAVRLCRNPAAG